jgi:hypothetical protein
MIKRVNFTGRRRIPRDRVDIEVFDGNPRSFNAIVNLNGIPLLSGAAVVLEATCAGSNTIERFEFGEVDNVRPPADRKLRQLESENVFFTLKVIDRTQSLGRILGMAEHIRPQRAGQQTATGRQGILPIEVREMGQELWQLDLQGHDATLFLNKDVPGLKDRARSDPFFYAIVYPEVVRRILIQAVLDGGDCESEADGWQNTWLRFGRHLHPAKDTPPAASDPEELRDEWIDEVVAAFCEAHQLRDKFMLAAAAREGGEL